MGLPWIKVYGELPTHRKSMALAVLLDEPRAWTHVVELWLWASRHAPNGDLAGLSDAVIARCAGWRGDGVKFVDALRQAGFLDGCVIHNWLVHNGAHQRKASADKVRNERRASESEVNKNNLTSESLVSHQRPTSVESIEYREEINTKNLAPPENPVAAGEQRTLTLASPSEATAARRRGRPPKNPEAHAAERADADRWLARVREITGLGDDVMRWSSAQFMAWRRLHKAHGVAKLMEALDGLADDKFSQSNGLGWFVSSSAFQKGIANKTRRAEKFGTNLEAQWEQYFAEQAAKEASNG